MKRSVEVFIDRNLNLNYNSVRNLSVFDIFAGALGVFRVMRYINVRYLLYLLTYCVTHLHDNAI